MTSNSSFIGTTFRNKWGTFHFFFLLCFFLPHLFLFTEPNYTNNKNGQRVSTFLVHAVQTETVSASHHGKISSQDSFFSLPWDKKTKKKMKHSYTPLLFFTFPKGRSSMADEMERIVSEMEQELHVSVQRLDIVRDRNAKLLYDLLQETLVQPSPMTQRLYTTRRILDGRKDDEDDDDNTDENGMTRQQQEQMLQQGRPIPIVKKYGPLLYHRESRQFIHGVQPYFVRHVMKFRAWAKGRVLTLLEDEFLELEQMRKQVERDEKKKKKNPKNFYSFWDKRSQRKIKRSRSSPEEKEAVGELEGQGGQEGGDIQDYVLMEEDLTELQQRGRERMRQRMEKDRKDSK